MKDFNESKYEFEQNVLKHIREYLPSEYAAARMQIIPSLKRPGGNLLQIWPELPDREALYPVIDLEKFYNKLSKEESDQANIYREIACTYLSGIRSRPAVLNEIVNDFNAARPRIRSRLLSRELCAEFIDSHVSVPVSDTDLAILYYVDVSDIMSGCNDSNIISIRQEMLAKWGISVEELQQAAIEGDRSRNEKIQLISDVVNEMTGEPLISIEGPQGPLPLYVLVSDSYGLSYGASALFHPDLSTELQNQFKDHGGYYVLPSSIHEVIVLPADGGATPEELAGIVQEINAEIVALEDQLSDHVYYVNTANEIVIAA